MLGGGPLALGLVEGVAEGTNSLLRIASGRISDRLGRTRPLVILGYIISSCVRPLIALASAPVHVLVVRFTDRVGKGIRSAPRDALLAAWAPSRLRGRVYGVHRAMDHAGAVVGPLLATVFLSFAPGEYRTLFLLTALPGGLAVALVLRVREPHGGIPSSSADGHDVTPVGAGQAPVSWRGLPGGFRRYLLIVALFTVGNSSDAFLLLRLTQAAGGPEYIPLLWAGLHVVKAALSTSGGALSDAVGRRPVIVLAWMIYALAYAGFAVSTSFTALAVWLLIYGLFYALSEGAERAYVADLAPAALRGSAFGLFHAVVGLGSLAASLLFGWLWSVYGAPAAFGLGATLAVSSTLLLILVRIEPQVAR